MPNTGGGGGGGGELFFILEQCYFETACILLQINYHSARNLGFILDSKLSMKKHVIKICQTAYFELKCISSIRRFSLKTQPRLLSYILSQLDYCNCLLMGTPNSFIQPVQKIQNFAARLVLLAPHHHHSTPLLEKLHWLPISECIK